MVPTFVIGLREGLEAALIVSIVATFLVGQGRRDALRWVWLGTLTAVGICAAIAVGLRIAENNLPQRQQEGLETVIGLMAAAMVSWMIIWMRKHARSMKAELESRASLALAAGSVGTLIVMAFLAVLREGLETAVFMLAAFQSARDPAAAGTGAVLGVVLAVGIGYGIYRGGVHINLQRFFKVTGAILVLVAAGLVATAAHTAHEAGWLNAAQTQVFDLSWLVRPGTVLSALLTGMLGIQPQPVVIEVAAYLLYAVPMLAFVLWPQRSARRQGAAVPAVAVGTAVLLVVALASCGSDDSSSSSSKNAAKTVKVKLVDEGCDPPTLKIAAGPTNFVVSNDDADAVTEFEILEGKRIVGEVENIPAGLEKSFSITLDPGNYTTYCPGGSKNDGKGKLTVTGTAAPKAEGASTAARAAAVAKYRDYLEDQTQQFVDKTTTFVNAVKSGDVDAAKAAYVPARLPYERIEPVAESFGDLDPAIDAREGDVPADQWGGFHKIEQTLWINRTTDGMAPVADQLLVDAQKLQTLVKTVELEPAAIANGAVELLNEVSNSKITGEEERYSRTDLDDLLANVEGSESAFEAVAPLLPEKSAVSATEITKRFDAVKAALAPYKQGEGFVLYTSLTPDQTAAISQKVDAVAEPLSKVAQQVVA